MTHFRTTVKSMMEELRKDSPALDRILQASEPRRNLALALVELRRATGLTQTELADAMGKDQAYVSRMESALGPFPTADSIAAYAHGCNATAFYVFATKEEEGPSKLITVPLSQSRKAMLAGSTLIRMAHEF